MRKRKLVRGVGINDADYEVSPRINGRSVQCPFYDRWHNMLRRCYNKDYKDKYKSYSNCLVCDEWLYFMNFKSWMEKQDWQGKALDKDLLVSGNRVYSPNTCIFIDNHLNAFMIENIRQRGDYMIGVCRYTVEDVKKPFKARCKDPFSEKIIHLGTFSSELEAHKAWQERKHQYACQLADLQSDPRVAKALRERYAPDKDWTQR